MAFCFVKKKKFLRIAFEQEMILLKNHPLPPFPPQKKPGKIMSKTTEKKSN